MAGGQVIELVGSLKIKNDLTDLIDRLVTPGAIFDAEFSILEEAERTIFAAHGGKYVMSGDLKNSLTERDATGAIRRGHGAYGIVEFGTSIWYARFQRRIDGPSGLPRGRKRWGPNQVLRITPAARQGAAAALHDYLYAGLGV